MSLKDLKMGIMLWLEGLLQHLLEKESLLLLLGSVKLWVLFLTRRYDLFFLCFTCSIFSGKAFVSLYGSVHFIFDEKMFVSCWYA